jgi:hypothetical protein
LAVAAVLSLTYYFWPEPSTAVVAAPTASVEQAEKRLERLRQIVATTPGKVKLLETLSAQVTQRETPMLAGETAAQAQSQLLQLARKVSPFDLNQVDMGPVQNYGDYYGEALLTIGFDCTVDQLLNFLADLSARPELIATRDIQIRAGDAKQKILLVRMTLSGLIPRKLVPQKKGFSLF